VTAVLASILSLFFSKGMRFSSIACLVSFVLNFLSMGLLGGIVFFSVYPLLWPFYSNYYLANILRGDSVWPVMLGAGLFFSLGFIAAGFLNRALAVLPWGMFLRVCIYLLVLWFVVGLYAFVVVHSLGKTKMTELHFAAQNNDVDVAKRFIAKGWDVNSKDLNMETPLTYAAGSSGEMIRLLLEKGADVNAQNLKGNTALHIATRQGKTDMTHLLITSGAKVNLANKDGETPLYHAALSGQAEAIRLLLDQHADIKLQPTSASTLLHAAAEGGNPELLDRLLRADADVNAKDQNLFTPLHSAAEFGQVEASRRLIKKGADVNAQSNTEATPLHLAIWYLGSPMYNDSQDKEASRQKAYDLVKLLLDGGSDPNILSWDGSPLHIAVLRSDARVIEMLIESGAEVELANLDGQTPTQLATQEPYNTKEVLQALGKPSADPNQKNKKVDK